MFKLIFTNSKGESVELFSPPYRLIRFDGLGDVSASHSTQKSPYQDGSTLINTTLDERHPEIELKITGRDEIELARNRRRLTAIFSPKLGLGTLKRVAEDGIHQLGAIAEALPFYPDGKGNRGKTFQKALIQLYCPNPFWQDINTTKEEIAIWRCSFEFPLELKEEGIEMGYREPSLIVNILNKGDVATGMRIQIKALATVVNPSLLNVNTREFFKINRIMEAGEIITINTHFQNKRVELNKNGVTSNAFNLIDLQSTFLQLEPGDNLLRYNADDGVDNLEVSIWFTPQYLGV